jgi:nucleoside-diphosphate-sugar epimerase
MTLIDPAKPILVTGASGYLGSWIVERLLGLGHTVHATVRDPSKASSVAHLEKIAQQSSGTLRLFKADLLDQGAFDAAMQDCELVMHTASPFIVTDYDDAEAALIRPALEGTRNVLGSVERSASVRRVVLTSSVAAIYGDAKESQQVPHGMFDETRWNTSSTVSHQPYQYSKTVAEREAWQWASQQQRWDLVCINPALIMGPALTTNSQSASISTLQEFGNGTLRMGAPKMWNGLVDVRDVADAHVKAGFNPAASGRYIICDRTLSLLDMGSVLRQHFGTQYPFPTMPVPTVAFWLVAPFYGYTRAFVSGNMGYPLSFNHDRSVRELGIQYRDVRQSICEHFQQLIDDGLVKKRV